MMSPDDPTSSVIEAVRAERVRQIEIEGNTREHDDEEHRPGDLALAAACYATPTLLYQQEAYANRVAFTDPWPWADQHDKRPSDGNVILPNSKLGARKRRRQLVIAAALLVAEIEFMDRAAAAKPAESE